MGDDHSQKLVALKIQKSASQYFDAAMDEIELLAALEKHKGEVTQFSLKQNYTPAEAWLTWIDRNA